MLRLFAYYCRLVFWVLIVHPVFYAVCTSDAGIEWFIQFLWKEMYYYGLYASLAVMLTVGFFLKRQNIPEDHYLIHALGFFAGFLGCFVYLHVDQVSPFNSNMTIPQMVFTYIGIQAVLYTFYRGATLLRPKLKKSKG